MMMMMMMMDTNKTTYCIGDDLKLHAKIDNDLKGLLSIIKRFSDDIDMQFGQDKCPKVSFKKVS